LILRPQGGKKKSAPSSFAPTWSNSFIDQFIHSAGNIITRFPWRCAFLLDFPHIRGIMLVMLLMMITDSSWSSLTCILLSLLAAAGDARTHALPHASYPLVLCVFQETLTSYNGVMDWSISIILGNKWPTHCRPMNRSRLWSRQQFFDCVHMIRYFWCGGEWQMGMKLRCAATAAAEEEGSGGEPTI
jgi:hypothetical protein